MEKSGQRYAPVVDHPPEPPLRHHDDDFVEVELDSVVSEKLALVWLPVYEPRCGHQLRLPRLPMAV